jgi:WhiB family transcriptional regulator, redox-sensing transcriptional regulator
VKRFVEIEPTPWMEQANCRSNDVDPEWFFPKSEHTDKMEIKAALKICDSCDVQLQCLQYALNQWPVDGIWGGQKNSQLRELIKRRRKAS